MIFIDIDSTTTRQKSGVSERGPWTMVFQQCSLVGHYQDGFPAKHPRETTIQLEETDSGVKPYPPGRYVIASESFFFGSFDKFTLGRLKLQPVKEFFDELQKQTGAAITVAKAAA